MPARDYMEGSMHRRILGLFAVGAFAAMSLAAAGGAAVSASGAAAEPTSAAARTGGTVIFGQDQEPRVLNGWITEGNLFATTEVVSSLEDGGMTYNNKAQLIPQLLAGQPRVIDTRPFTIRWRYKANAKWYDGRQITARDMRFLWQTIMAKEGDRFRWDIVSRVGWEDISAIRGNGKVVTVVFRKPFANWKASIAAAGPLPEHALRGENFNQVWRNDRDNPKTGQPINNGPYILQSWQRGQQLRVVRNPRYYGRKAYLAAIVYRFVPNTATQFQALRAGELNVLRPQFQVQIDEIKRDRRFVVQQGPEYVWEHIDFQQGPQGHAALKRKYVRSAIAAAINRRQIANTLFRPVVQNLPVLNSVMYKNFEPKYRNNWGRIQFSQRRAINILRANRCTGGPARPGAGGVYSCPTVGRLEFRYTTNLGANARRALMFQIVKAQLQSVGIVVNADSVPGLQPRLGGSNWDIFNFAWVGSPTSPITYNNVYGCGRPQNFKQYCNRRVSRLLDQVAATVNDKKREAMIQRADRLIAADIPTIPMFAAPGFAVHQRNVRQVLRNPTNASLFWNSGTWWVQ
jgi:peptide/nickel transport system substrate-binding protein